VGRGSMNSLVYNEFLSSDDKLRVYKDNELVFSSRKKGLLAILDYFDRLTVKDRKIVILDKVTGNAAALLSIKADCTEIWSPLGSKPAVETLDKYGIQHHFTRIVNYISQDNSIEMCPMERLSLGKNPDEFFIAIKAVVNGETKTT
jgi:hypothetical protein